FCRRDRGRSATPCSGSRCLDLPKAAMSVKIYKKIQYILLIFNCKYSITWHGLFVRALRAAVRGLTFLLQRHVFSDLSRRQAYKDASKLAAVRLC
ncbi:MAG: hypothetical protein K6A35_00295, partial [bacterium]|nr:hypothetical protein [bacterium]